MACSLNIMCIRDRVYRVDKKHHAGLVVASPDPGRIEALLNDYANRFAGDFLAVLPPLDKAPT